MEVYLTQGRGDRIRDRSGEKGCEVGCKCEGPSWVCREEGPTRGTRGQTWMTVRECRETYGGNLLSTGYKQKGRSSIRDSSDVERERTADYRGVVVTGRANSSRLVDDRWNFYLSLLWLFSHPSVLLFKFYEMIKRDLGEPHHDNPSRSVTLLYFLRCLSSLFFLCSFRTSSVNYVSHRLYPRVGLLPTRYLRFGRRLYTFQRLLIGKEKESLKGNKYRRQKTVFLYVPGTREVFWLGTSSGTLGPDSDDSPLPPSLLKGGPTV